MKLGVGMVCAMRLRVVVYTHLNLCRREKSAKCPSKRALATQNCALINVDATTLEKVVKLRRRRFIVAAHLLLNDGANFVRDLALSTRSGFAAESTTYSKSLDKVVHSFSRAPQVFIV